MKLGLLSGALQGIFVDEAIIDTGMFTQFIQRFFKHIAFWPYEQFSRRFCPARCQISYHIAGYQHDVDEFVLGHDLVLELDDQVDGLVDLSKGESVEADFHGVEEFFFLEEVAAEKIPQGEGPRDRDHGFKVKLLEV